MTVISFIKRPACCSLPTLIYPTPKLDLICLQFNLFICLFGTSVLRKAPCFPHNRITCKFNRSNCNHYILISSNICEI